MDINDFNARLRSEVRQFNMAGRTESAAFLMWYLNNFFRLEQQDAIDCVCDSSNDKGIDGIYVDDDAEEIYLFQSKYSPNDNRDQGDNDLRNFKGAKEWFRDETAVHDLLRSTASADLKSLVTRQKIKDKIGLSYSLYQQFVTNKVFDQNAQEFLSVNQESLEGLDTPILFSKYTYIADKPIQTSVTTLSLVNLSKITYNLPNGIIARVYPIPVKELLKLDGIQDRTLFYKNVRYGLGKTRVNQEIRKTIHSSKEHNNFFLYHNGITLICDTLDESTPNQISIKNYSIINGCQSILTFYENRPNIGDDMYVLAKIIKIEPDSPLIRQITYFANNQNAISLKDLKSSDRVQIGLQNEFFKLFNNKVLYRIKRGESEAGYDVVIDIDFAAQLVESFYLRSPHGAHLKSALFSERYNKIFSRHINAAKIVLAHIIYNIVDRNMSKIKNEQIRDYSLAKYCFIYIIAEILSADEKGRIIIEEPTLYIFKHGEALQSALTKLWELLTPDINAYIDEYTEANGNFFDYKNVFKNAEFTKTMCRKINSDHEKIVVRHPEDKFSNLFTS